MTKTIMEVFVIIEMFKGGVMPKIRGVYQDEMEANEIKNDYHFAFIDKQQLIQTEQEKNNKEVYIVMEVMTLNVPNVVGVFKNKELAEEMALSCKYNAQVIGEQLI